MFIRKHGGKGACRLEKDLSSNAIQFYGYVPSTGLEPCNQFSPSISAGLPHFSTHHMRCWGRDIFICLKGLYLDLGLFDIARSHILAFAACLKHGLIPNLLDAGRRPRYNARDATWFFLKSVQDYVCVAPEGVRFLDCEVKMRFFDDDIFIDHNSDMAFCRSKSIRDIMQDIMQRHFDGIHFVEWGAGPQLDHAMKFEGFRIDINFDKTTGFIFGGNSFNCGTWMDKMGESDKAGNNGIPATPRNGAAVEIIGLLKCALNWFATLAQQKKFPGGVISEGTHFSYNDWSSLIQQNFERYFFIPESHELDCRYQVNRLLIKRRGIYKDTYSMEDDHNNYSLRPNFVLAISVVYLLFHVFDELITMIYSFM